MRWSIDLGDGKPPRGPFHRDAVDALLARGRLPETVKIIESREPWPAEDLNFEEPVDEMPEQEFIIDEDFQEESVQEEAAHRIQETPLPQEPANGKTEEETAVPPPEEDGKREECQPPSPQPEETAIETTVQEQTIQNPEPENKEPELPNMPQDASVLYGLMREEAENLEKMIAAETRETEEFRKASQERRDRMQERRQAILRLIGSDADDMVRRARITHPTVARDANLRQDYNALRLLQERITREAKNKIDILTERLNKSELETQRLRRQMVDTATLSKQLADTRETLQRREKEIVAERQRFEEERQRFAMERQALLSRLSSLESGIGGDTNQAREARGVKIAPWMSLKK
jgi:hypothetical protein